MNNTKNSLVTIKIESVAIVAHYYYDYIYFVDGTDYDSTDDILDKIYEV